MKKLVIVSTLVIVLALGIAHVAFAGRCGETVGGSFLGSFAGTTMSNAMTQRPSSGGSDDGRALRAVDRLEDMMRRDLQTLNKKIEKLERRLEKLEENCRRARSSSTQKNLQVDDQIIESVEQ